MPHWLRYGIIDIVETQNIDINLVLKDEISIGLPYQQNLISSNQNFLTYKIITQNGGNPIKLYGFGKHIRV